MGKAAVRAIFALTCLTLLGLLASIVASLVVSPNSFRYGVIVDAGSSRTTAYAYRFPNQSLRPSSPSSFPQGLGHRPQFHNRHFGPYESRPADVRCAPPVRPNPAAIASFAQTPSAAGDAVASLLAAVRASIPADSVSSTPVYFFATAGMRLLEQRDPAAAAAILVAIRGAIVSGGFMSVEGGVQIISGEDEGKYAWASANYLKNALRDSSTITTGI
jgi:apyrase